MAKATMNNINVLNAVRAKASLEYKARIPEATQENIDDIYNTLLDPFNSITRDELVPALVEMIASQRIQYATFRNPLRMLNDNAMPFGAVEQEIYVNFAKGYEHNHKITNEEATAIYDSYIMGLYHHINFDMDYPVTIYYEDLRTAFLDEYGMRNLIQAKSESVISACNLDEFSTAKQLVVSAYNAGCTYPVHVDGVTNTEQAQDLLVKLQTYIGKVQFPNVNLNYAGANSFAGAGEMLFVTTPEAKAVLNVYTYAGAYNLDKMIPDAQQIIIDSFNDNPNIIGVLVDKRFFRIREQLRMMANDGVQRGRRYNLTYMLKAMFSYSLFFPIIVFTKDTVGVTAINCTDTKYTAGADNNLTVTTTFADKGFGGMDVSISGNSSSDTYIIPGTTILRVDKSETGTITVKFTNRANSAVTKSVSLTKQA